MSADGEASQPADSALASDSTDRFESVLWIQRTFVLPERKMLYVSAPKNACTSLKWLVAEVAGEDLSAIRPGRTPLTTATQAIHRRRLLRRTPTLAELPPEVRKTIDPDEGWFVFGVLRDPRSRLFSAWADKLLMRDPWLRAHRNEPWYPAVPESVDDIVEGFAKFVAAIEANPDLPVLADTHFNSQTRLMAPDVIPFSRLYDVSEVSGRLVPDLVTHLRAHGWNGDLHVRQSNETVLRANARVLGADVRAAIERIYADDFARFGDRWDPSVVENAAQWPADVLGAVLVRIELNERIGNLLADLRRTEKRAREAEAESQLG